MPKSRFSPEPPESTSSEQPPDELRPPGDDDPPPRPVRINSVSPIGGALAGGIDVTLTGSGFQPGAEVFFGDSQSLEVIVESTITVKAKLPPATQTGTVSVTLVNPDGTSATRPGGFTYVTTESSLHAEVHGVEPLAVIEDTDSEITIRGRNLIAAYNDGIVVLRGPARVNVTFSNFGSSTDEATGIESLILTVRVTATPPLRQHERMAIQVLASLRPGAANDGVFETSRQMFTVLPRAVPVVLGFTANLVPNRPNLVMVAGRNLEGYSLDMGQGATVHLQTGDDQTLAGIVSFAEGAPVPESAQLRLIDPAGSEAGQFDMTVGPSPESSAAKSSTSGERAMSDPAEPGDPDGPIPLTLTPAPGQELTGPTAEDSAVFHARGESLSLFSFNFGDFEFTIWDDEFVIPLFNEVRLIPFFDNGVGDLINNTPVLAEVGKLFRLRGVGLLVALRVDLVIRFEIILIIGFRFDIWGFGLYNEFPQFGWAIGSIVVGIRVRVRAFLLISFLVALVKPGGQLRVLFFFNLSLGVDFFLSTDGREIDFGTRFKFKVDYTKVSPFANLANLLLCNGTFQLAAENGRTAFTDNFGGSQSFYFPRAAGRCCLPWEFDFRLVRFEDGGSQETVQAKFRADFCVTAVAPQNVVNIFITSEHPAPTGIGPQRRLTMTFNDRAALFVMAQPADINGTPTGSPQDITTLGYNVEFYLDPFGPDLFNPVLLPSGDAAPVQAGDSTIHARIWLPGQGEFFNFRPEDVVGFDILRFISQGLLPAILGGTLPVTVRDPTEIVVTPTLAFREGNRLIESPSLFANQGEVVREIERYEPWEYDSSPIPKPQQLEYTLAARISFPTNAQFPQEVTFTIKESPQMVVLIGTNTTPESEPPLEGTNLLGTRTTDKDVTHFFAKVVQKDQAVKINFQQRPANNELFELKDSNREFKIAPHIRDEGQNHLVPPGKLVADRQVMLLIDLKAESDRSGTAVADIKQLKLAVRNDETYEEYLRVLPEVRTILNGAVASIGNFPRNFFSSLPAEGSPTASQLAAKGKELWDFAVADVQNSRDDRPLYWARLQAICALRAYYKRNRLGPPTVSQFEWPSRGLEEADGSISFGTPTPPGRKAVFTGFDPFALPQTPKRSNPSGLAALALNNKDFGPPGALVHVRSVVIPVRYDDFDRNLIEGIASSGMLGSIEMLMTCSDNFGRPFYDVERWAGKMRGTGLTDNNAIFKGGPARGGVIAPGGAAAGGPQYLESTLPYELVIATPTDTLAGPSGNKPFVMDQSYEIVNADPRNPGEVRPSPEPGDPDKTAWFTKLPEQPKAGATSLEGSGGNYLSNEIFYRVALAREATRPTLPPGKAIVPTGHFHVPSTGTDPASTGPNLITGVTEALNRLLAAAILPRLRSVANLIFLNTVKNNSRSLTLTATNDFPETITINSADVAPPFTVALPGPVPIPVGPGAALTLTLTFTPTDFGSFIRAVRLRNPEGRFVLATTLKGEGVQTIPAPQITRFDPASGFSGEDTVTITGANLDGTTAVRIGTLASPFTPVSDTEISADVIGSPRMGKISVDTPSGTAVSSGFFTVRRRRIQPEDLAIQFLARRTELELNPGEAAAQLGVTSTTYKRWERGLDVPRTRYRPAIVLFLGHDPSGEPESFGERIREAREREGLSKPQLAQRLGISTSTIHAWEADTISRPTTRVVNIFEDYLNEV